jgi:hypothetical protein
LHEGRPVVRVCVEGVEEVFLDPVNCKTVVRIGLNRSLLHSSMLEKRSSVAAEQRTTLGSLAVCS